MAHPLDPLSPAEVTAAVAAVRADGRLPVNAWFSTVVVDEWGAGSGRHARLVIVPGPEAALVEAVVALADPAVVDWVVHDGARPALGFGESFAVIIALHAHDGFVAALAARGITDLDKVQIDPWPTGSFGHPTEEGRRVARCLCFYREEPGDNGYARPIEGLQALVDMARGEVLEILDDQSVVPLPPERGSYLPEDHPPRRDLKPLEISQPDGVSFALDGHELRWQGWTLHVSLDPLEGIVLRDVGYDDGNGVRSILRRAAVSEMVVPYGDPGPDHGWKNAFDVGEWGLGRLANSLALGCDCLGEIRYLDTVFADEQGVPQTLAHAICLHEEDVGILWKHQDLFTGRTEVRRSRRMVISSIATVGNYEYGFYWYLYLDGTIQHEVKLTGIMSTQAVGDGGATPHAPLVAPGLAAPVHQHLFCARLDLDVDGAANEVHEVDVVAVPTGEGNPQGNAFAARATRLDSEHRARRRIDPSRSRAWKVTNPTSRNGLGQPVAYKLVPGATPTLLADPASSIGRRAGFATENLWVTPYEPDERRAAGDHPNQHAGGDGLPRWTAADRSLVDTDVVVWHTFGVTHVPRPEDWPVMPVEYTGFTLVPVGFFDRNPALD
ncbi:MAG TPA: primary-amine oxidase, partial [Iamia sp.]|nr:primary-amine oxidase [Iamia sp.]